MYYWNEIVIILFFVSSNFLTHFSHFLTRIFLAFLSPHIGDIFVRDFGFRLVGVSHSFSVTLTQQACVLVPGLLFFQSIKFSHYLLEIVISLFGLNTLCNFSINVFHLLDFLYTVNDDWAVLENLALYVVQHAADFSHLFNLLFHYGFFLGFYHAMVLFFFLREMGRLVAALYCALV